jgi:hypothetical protein
MSSSERDRSVTFDGDEEGVFHLDGLHQLSGVHGRMLCEALWPGEAVHHLVLCPWWECSTKPFDVEPVRACHALCLTDRRLLITRQYLGQIKEDSIISIDRGSLAGLEFGKALLMSWLAIYARRGRAIIKEGLYFPSRGNGCVTRLLHDMRHSWPVQEVSGTGVLSLPPPAIYQTAGYFHECLLQPLLLATEKCLRVAQRPPIWGYEPGWWGRLRPVGLAHWGTLLLTDRAFVYVCGKPGLGPKEYVFDYNLVCFSLTSLCRVECLREHAHGARYSLVRLTFDEEGRDALEVLFPESQADLAAEWTRELASLTTRLGIATESTRHEERVRSGLPTNYAT